MAYMSMFYSVELLATLYSVMLPSTSTAYSDPRETRVGGCKTLHQCSANYGGPTKAALVSSVRPVPYHLPVRRLHHFNSLRSNSLPDTVTEKRVLSKTSYKKYCFDISFGGSDLTLD